ncbi:MAG TPA: phage holin family protein [Mycobacteriales bacterium]|nr:phage holin family protein [Mycobacteriales bacterium]
MSTPGNDSSGRHRDDTAGSPAPLFDPAARRSDGTAPTGTLAPPASGNGAGGPAPTTSEKISGRASGAAHAAADKFASMRSSIRTPKDSTPAATKPDEPSVGDLVKDASTHMSTLVRNEIELAKTELTATVKKAAIGGALFILAAVIILYSLTFGLIGAAEAIHSAGGMPRWASYLLVLCGLLLIAVAAILVGVLLLKRMKKPERTLTTVKETAAWAKSRGKSD